MALKMAQRFSEKVFRKPEPGGAQKPRLRSPHHHCSASALWSVRMPGLEPGRHHQKFCQAHGGRDLHDAERPHCW